MAVRHAGNIQPQLDLEEHLGTVNAKKVAIIDGSGNQITSFGGGTQYINNISTASVTGTVVLGQDFDSTLDPLPLSGNSVAVSTAKISFQAEFEATTGWSANAQATNLATTTSHRGVGTNFLTFDKAAGGTQALISKTITARDISAYGLGASGFIWIYVSSLTNISSINILFGTDSSNYCQWDFDVANLVSGWNFLQAGISNPTSQTGNGYNLSAVSYFAIGVTFNGAGNTLTGIITGGATLQRSVELGGQTSSTVVTTGNINVAKIGGSPIDKNTGASSAGTQRVVLANNEALPPGANYLGLATVNLGVGTRFIGLVTTVPGGNVTLNPSAAYIGLTTTQLGAGDRFIGLVTNTQAGLTTLAPSPNYIGLVSVSGSVGIVGNVTISDSKGFIGLTTVKASVLDTFASLATLTISLASLANSTAGVGRQSTLVDNTTNKYQSALIYLKITTGGSAPTANSWIYAYLLRSDNNTVTDDNAGASDAGLTVVNASLLGAILVSTNGTNTAYNKSFDTSPLGPLGPKWGIAIVNSTGQALNGTEGNHLKNWIGRNPQLT